jgi:hypothetical protein
MKSGSIEVQSEITHSPTPSSLTNRAFEFRAVYKKYNIVRYDVVSAFPHAEEKRDVYMRAPPEYLYEFQRRRQAGEYQELLHVEKPLIKLVGSLYGRRTASADFRDYMEEAVLAADGQYVRGILEPTLYYSENHDTAMTHHVDDGTICGPDDRMMGLIENLMKFMLLKYGDFEGPGSLAATLGRQKMRLEDGFITEPDDKHIVNILDATELHGCKPVTTPGIKYVWSEAGEQLLDEDRTTRYRSATGSFIYYSADRSEIKYSVKELAKRMSKPRECDWLALKRLTQYIVGARDIVMVNRLRISREDIQHIDYWHDGDWAGSEDFKSTSGIVGTVGGFILEDSSTTQPGLPALSSGESELRSSG